MKKVLNISTVQQALRRLPVAFLIAGSGFLPTASAVRWTIDFKNKQGGSHIMEKDLTIYTAIIRDWRAWNIQRTLKWSEFSKTEWMTETGQMLMRQYLYNPLIEQSKATGTVHECREDNSSEITVVLRNGILDAREAKKLLKDAGAPFNAEFVNCKGVLDLNENFRKHAKSIRFDDCEFEIAANCFKDTKVLQFYNTKLTPKDGRLGISKSTEVQFDTDSWILPWELPLVSAICLEQNGKSIAGNNPDKNTGKVSNGVIESEKPFETKTDSHPRDSEKELSSPQTRHDRLGKEPAETKIQKEDNESCKAKIRQLEEEVKEKDRTIDGLRAKLGESEKNEKDARHGLLETLRSRNKESGMLVSSLEGAQEDLQAAQCRNRMLENTIAGMKERNAQLKRENDKLLKNKTKCETRMKDLET